MYVADHNDILHTSRQCHCRDVCKISLWSVEYIRNKSILNFHRISNSIEICLVGRAPGRGPTRFEFGARFKFGVTKTGLQDGRGRTLKFTHKMSILALVLTFWLYIDFLA